MPNVGVLNKKKWSIYFLVATVCFLITACGSGSSSSGVGSLPSTPTTPTTPNPSPVAPPSSGITARIVKIDSSTCPEIAVYVSVDDESNQTVLNLTQQNFQLLENSVEQNIEVYYEDFATESIVFSLLMDYSLSLTDQDLLKVEEAATYFVQELFDVTSSNILENWGEVIKFVRQSQIMQEFTNDEIELIDGIESSAQARGEKATFLYDAIGNSISRLTDFRNVSSSDIPEKSILIVITDGQDNVSEVYNKDEIIDSAINGGIQLVTIGIGSDIDEESLRQMSDDTGGRYFFAPTTDDLLTIFTQFLDNLKNLYILKYRTSEPNNSNVVEVYANTSVGSGSDSHTFECQ